MKPSKPSAEPFPRSKTKDGLKRWEKQFEGTQWGYNKNEQGPGIDREGKKFLTEKGLRRLRQDLDTEKELKRTGSVRLSKGGAIRDYRK